MRKKEYLPLGASLRIPVPVLSALCLIFLLGACGGESVPASVNVNTTAEEEQKWLESIISATIMPVAVTLEDDVLEEEPEPEDVIVRARIAAVGDLMVHTWQLKDAYNSETGEYDFSNDFEMVQNYLNNADFRVGNLETVFGGGEIGYSDYPMFNTPDSFGEALKVAGFNLLTTANNHSLDKREAGLLRTLDVLDDLGIAHVGTYRSWEERDNIQIVDINGIQTAFLSFTYGTNGIPVPEEKEYLINILSDQLIIEDINRAKALSPDLIVVLPHMGNEYETYTRDAFRNTIDAMFYYGADIVLASHPHVLQPMERRTITDVDGLEREVFAAYSLGNFISSQRTEPRDYSMILNIEVTKTNDEKPVIDKVTFVPTWVQARNLYSQDYVRVLPVGDMITDYINGIDNNIRPHDYNRLVNVHKEITKMYFGQSVSLEDMKSEYLYYKRLDPVAGDDLS